MKQSIQHVLSNSKDGSDSTRFKRGIGMNRAKLGTPQFEDKLPDWQAANGGGFFPQPL